MMRTGIHYTLIGLAIGLAIAAFTITISYGLDRELDRREAAEFDFYCNFKKEC